MYGRAYEVATFRSEGPYLDGRHPSQVSFVGPKQDAQRRDFTVNGLFYDPLAARVIDYIHGRRRLAAPNHSNDWQTERKVCRG